MTYLSKFNLALAAVLAGTRNAKILFIGDETTAGAGANGSIFSTNNISYSFPTQLAPLIATATGLTVSTDVVLGDNGLGNNGGHHRQGVPQSTARGYDPCYPAASP